MFIDLLRAWKDPEYRKSLTPEELACVPENPAGNAELSAEDLASLAAGGQCCTTSLSAPSHVCSIVCVTNQPSCPSSSNPYACPRSP